ncbi:MAG: lytic transglycosylase domain-containing protein [Candidatus Margulisiibacteriota bacterium]
MTLTLLSAVALLAVVLFGQPSSPPGEKNVALTDAPVTTVSSVQTAPLQPKGEYPSLEFPSDKDADYQVILAFVQKTHKKIPEDEAADIVRHLVEYAHQNQVDPKFAAALMARESSFNKRAISATGAKGLGQIKDFNFPALNITDPFDIEQNVGGTLSYLKAMLNEWSAVTATGEKAGLALSSYFRGIGAMRRDGGQVDEKTQRYVDDILSDYESLLTQREVLYSPMASTPPEN